MINSQIAFVKNPIEFTLREQIAIDELGENSCKIMANLCDKGGEGPSNIACMWNITTKIANAAIDAGRKFNA